MAFFSNSSSESAIDSPNQFSVIEEKTDDVFDPVLGKLKVVVGNKSLYVPRARQLLFNQRVSVWELNRPIDENHVKNIVDSLEAEYKETKQITVFGSLGLFREDNVYKIFDGQHRSRALELILEKYPNLNPELTVEVYETKNPIDLFTKLNQIKPQDEKTKPDSKKEKLVKLIQARFTDRVKSQRQVHRPRVTLKALMDTINTGDFAEESPESIMSRLENINAQLARCDMEKLFEKEYQKNPELCTRIYDQASQMGFYLGLRKLKNSRLDWTL